MMTPADLQEYINKTIANAKQTISRLTATMEQDPYYVLSMHGDDLALAAARVEALTRWQKVIESDRSFTVDQVKEDALDRVLYLSSASPDALPSSPSRRLVRNMTLAVWTDLYKRIG